MWEYFCLFSVVILVAIWLVQIVFFQYFYIRNMATETLANSREIVALYKEGRLNERKVRDAAYKNNMTIIITDKQGNVISASNAMGEINPQMVEKIKERYKDNIENLRQKLENDETKDSYARLQNVENDRKEFFFVAYSEEGVELGGTYIYVISQIEPITAVVVVLQRQFLFSTLISLVIALVFAYFIAQKFSRPVEKLTVSARELALGNNKVDFTVKDAFGEIAELSSALEYASDEINKSSKLRKELIANVSHDLRTPLSMIKMYAEMIRDITGDNKEKRDKNLKIIIDETDRLARLVNDILELSRQENSNELKRSNFDITALAKAIIERFSILEDYKILLEAPQELVVYADFEKIQQVIYNLLSNAINYTGEDKTVIIKITKQNKNALIQIIDSGKGISQEEMPLIWDRYYRNKTHVRSKVGTGLGLSIVKSILIIHQVDFGIKSTKGQGSDFWFNLKLAENGCDKIKKLGDNNNVVNNDCK